MDRDERKRMVAQAKVGLDALIDEATGYQQQRPKDELRKRYAELGGDEGDYRCPDDIEGVDG
jgi:hypothetical protein